MFSGAKLDKDRVKDKDKYKEIKIEININKIESLQKRAPRYLYNNYESPYNTLLAKSGIGNMKASRLRSLCLEIKFNKPIFFERNF